MSYLSTFEAELLRLSAIKIHDYFALLYLYPDPLPGYLINTWLVSNTDDFICSNC